MSISLRFRELVRHFLMRFYDNDMLSPDGDQAPGVASALGLMAAPGILIPLLLMQKYLRLYGLPIAVRDISSIGEKYLFVSLSLTVVGFVTVLQWDALFPDRRDYMVLCPLPLRLRTILGAKICSLMLVVGGLVAAVISLSPVLFPAVVLGPAPLSVFLWFAGCHLAAVGLGCLFVFLAVVGTQGLLLNVLPYRIFRRISPLMQLLLLLGLAAQFVLSNRAFSRLNYQQPHNHWIVNASPSMWFVGLYQYGMGWHQSVFRELARTGLAALALAAALAIASYAIAYRRHMRRCLESGETQGGAPGWLRSMLASFTDSAIVRHPLQRAVFRFIIITISRSRKQRLYVCGYAGLALAAIFQLLSAALAGRNHAWLYRPNRLLVWTPFVLLFVVLPGLRHAYAIPAELKANWVFRLAEGSNHEHMLRGVRRATLVLGVLPICMGLLPVYAWLWGPLNALVHTAFGMSVALVAREILLFGFNKIPFTCSYVPRRADAKACLAAYLLLFSSLIYLLGVVEMWILKRPWLLAIPVAAAAVVMAVGASLRREDSEPLLFDDQPDPAVRELGLSV